MAGESEYDEVWGEIFYTCLYSAGNSRIVPGICDDTGVEHHE